MTDRPSVGTDSPAPPRPAPAVHRAVEVAAAYAWRLLAIGLAVAAFVWLTGQLLVVVVPLAVAALLTRALAPPVSRLRRAGWRPGLAAAAVLVGFLISLGAVVAAVGVAVAGELGEVERSARGSTTSRTGSSRTDRSTSAGPTSKAGGSRPATRWRRSCARVTAAAWRRAPCSWARSSWAACSH